MFGIEPSCRSINQVLDPGLVWVKADSPYKTFADLIEAAKKNPGKISACTTGILSDDHLAILMTHEAAKVEFRIVHFDGGAQQITGVMGGHVDVAFDNVGGVFKRVRSGECAGWPCIDNERSKFLPDVPTAKELGYPTIISSSTRGIGVQKGTPAGRHQGARGRLPEGDADIPSTTRSSRMQASASSRWSARNTPSTTPTCRRRRRSTRSGR